MFNGKYLDWNRKKLKGIIDFYTTKFMSGIKVLDLGGGYGDISGPLSRFGADITLVDLQQDYLNKTSSDYPNIKTIKLDLAKGWLSNNQSFDLILHLSLLNELPNYEENLKNTCQSTKFLVLEAAVCDDNDPYKIFSFSKKNINEANHIYYLPTAANIERLLLENGMKFQRIDHSKFNFDSFIYDWKDKLDGSFSLNQRRIWFCEKSSDLKKNIINNSNAAPILTLKSTDILISQNINTPRLGQLQDKVSMSSFSYTEFSKTRAKFISDLFNPKYFLRKSIFDAGAGTGEISGYFSKNGGTVTAADARQEHLQAISKKYPNIKTIRSNFEAPLSVNAKYDITFSIDTLCHISNYEKHLKDLCAKSVELILETAVCDSNDPNINFNVAEDSSNKMLSATGMGSRPSAAKIEKILSESGMHFIRVDSSELNYNNYVYDWNVINSKNQDISLRRFWICSRRENVVKEIGKKYSVTSKKVVISSPSFSVPPKLGITQAATVVKPINRDTTYVSEGVTVIIPAYKASKFIDECIDSIKVQQGVNDIQIIVGIDACQETLNHFQKNKEKYNDVYIYYFDSNVSPYVVKNSLVDKARCDNILFFDADDILISGALSKMLNVFQKDPKAEMVRFKYLNFNDAQGIKSARDSGDFAHGLFLIKKNCFNKLNGFEGWKCAADTEFVERANFNKIRVYNLQDNIFYRRLHKDSLTGTSQTGYSSKLREEYKKIINNKRKNKSWSLSKKIICNFITLNTVNEQQLLNSSLDIKNQDSVKNNLNANTEGYMGNINKIYHIIPWNTEKNLGKAYNEFMGLLQDNDWACFLDGDAVHTTTYFGKYIENILSANPNYDLLTCYTNRIGCKYQIPSNVNWQNDSQKYHREIGNKLWEKNGTSVLNITSKSPLSGVLILISKKMWSYVGGFKEEKMLSIDNNIHEKVRYAGGKIGLMEGIYVQHWYRGGDINQTRHLTG